jgi:hypothetical protein
MDKRNVAAQIRDTLFPGVRMAEAAAGREFDLKTVDGGEAIEVQEITRKPLLRLPIGDVRGWDEFKAKGGVEAFSHWWASVCGD